MILNTKFKPQKRQLLKIGLLGSAMLSPAVCGVLLSRQSNTRSKFFMRLQHSKAKNH